MRRLIALFAQVTMLSVGSVVVAPSAGSQQPAFPIRAAFYYNWFPETWHAGTQPDHQTPSLGRYDSGDSTVLAAQISQARYAGLDAFISGWWGIGHRTDVRLPKLLAAAQAQGFHVTIYHEPEGIRNPTVAELQQHLAHLKRLADQYPAAWLRVGGRPVIFVYNTGDTDCSTANRWVQASAGWYINLKVFPGFRNCVSQPASWHQYGPRSPEHSFPPDSFTVSPGYFHWKEATPRLARNVTRWEQNLRQQVASRTRWQLVTSWNEHGEGHPIEPAAQWSSPSGMGHYLDVMRRVYADKTPLPSSA